MISEAKRTVLLLIQVTTAISNSSSLIMGRALVVVVVVIHMGTQGFLQELLLMLLGALRWLIETGVDLLMKMSCNKLFLLVIKGFILRLLGCSCFSSRILMILYDLVSLFSFSFVGALFSLMFLNFLDFVEQFVS
jgi:hypothetical protein